MKVGKDEEKKIVSPTVISYIQHMFEARPIVGLYLLFSCTNSRPS